LDGRPGVYAARYAGEQATYADNCRKLLQELSGVPREQRTARFLTVAALAGPDGTVRVTQGTLDGVITEQPRGGQGFGYDPVFFVPALGRTLAELSPAEKNAISHRAAAFRKMKEILRGL
jgi:XTP/dITP diphosphohydrolase